MAEGQSEQDYARHPPYRRATARLAASHPQPECRAARYYGANATRFESLAPPPVGKPTGETCPTPSKPPLTTPPSRTWLGYMPTSAAGSSTIRKRPRGWRPPRRPASTLLN